VTAARQDLRRLPRAELMSSQTAKLFASFEISADNSGIVTDSRHGQMKQIIV